MKKSALPLFLLIMVVLAAFLVIIVWKENALLKNPDTMLSAEQEEENAGEDIVSVTAAPLKTPEPTETPAETLGEETGDNTVTATLAVAGDIVMHTGLNAEAKTGDSYDYSAIFGGSTTYIREADCAICTLETSLTGGPDYTGYPLFTSPDNIAWSLKDIGFDLVNLASNHCLDGGLSGLTRTIGVFRESGVSTIGTYDSQEARDENHGIVVKELNGITVAFLSYTYGTNGLPVTGDEYAVNLFFTDYLTNLSEIDYALLEEDMAAARALNTDMIAVLMHWGNEYYTEPVAYQEELADFFFAQGADMIFGGHCHVPEPMELRQVTDSDGSERTCLLAYCLGNYVSCQNDRYTDLTCVLNVTLSKDTETGKAVIGNVDYVPMYMVDLDDFGISTDWRYRLWNIHEALSAYESGSDWGVITPELYESLQTHLDDLHSILDPAYDRYNRQASAEEATTPVE